MLYIYTILAGIFSLAIVYGYNSNFGVDEVNIPTERMTRNLICLLYVSWYVDFVYQRVSIRLYKCYRRLFVRVVSIISDIYFDKL